MKTLLYSLALLVICGLTFSDLSAQNTCATAQVIDLYQDSQFSSFTTGIPSDNATSGAQTCGLALGTGGQRWYMFTFNGCSPAELRMTTCMASNLTNFDTQIHVYTGTCGNLTCVGSDDDSGCDLTSDITYVINPGVTYRVRIGGYGTANGTFYLNTYLNGGGCTDPTACNYSQFAEWDNCSCYYGTMAQFSTTLSPGIPAGGGISIYQGQTAIDYADPGVTSYFCEEDICGINIFFTLPAGVTSWQGSTYSLTIHGNLFSGVIPDPGVTQYSIVAIDDPACGCTTPGHINYSEQAVYDDGTCEPFTVGSSCLNPLVMEMNSAVYMDTDGEPMNMVELYPGQYALAQDKWCSFVYNGGAVRISAHGGDPVLLVKDDCGGNVLSYMDDFSPYLFISLNAIVSLGCTDGLVRGQTYYVQTYNLNAGSDYSVEITQTDFPGCTDPMASNYNACASIDDGSCDTCPADLDNSGVVNVTDLLQFVSAYGSSCN